MLAYLPFESLLDSLAPLPAPFCTCSGASSGTYWILALQHLSSSLPHSHIPTRLFASLEFAKTPNRGVKFDTKISLRKKKKKKKKMFIGLFYVDFG